MIRVGVVGAGFMASNYLEVLSESNDWEICGIVTRTSASARRILQSHQRLQVFPTIADMYNLASPDLVIIAVPELATFGVMQQIWDYPWTSVVEKPAGYNLREATLLADQCRTRSRSSFVALNRRFYESVTTAKGLLEKELGPRYIAVVDQHDVEAARSSGQPAEVVQNWHFANAIHTVDLIRHFSEGTITSVDAQIWDGDRNQRLVDARIGFDNGDVATYQSYWNMPQTWSLSCATKAVRVLLSPLERVLLQQRGERTLVELPQSGPDRKFKPGLAGILAAVKAFLAGEGNSLPSLDDALQSMVLLERIYGKS